QFRCSSKTANPFCEYPISHSLLCLPKQAGWQTLSSSTLMNYCTHSTDRSTVAVAVARMLIPLPARCTVPARCCSGPNRYPGQLCPPPPTTTTTIWPATHPRWHRRLHRVPSARPTASPSDPTTSHQPTRTTNSYCEPPTGRALLYDNPVHEIASSGGGGQP